MTSKRLSVLISLMLICLMPTMANAARNVDKNSVTWTYAVNSDGTTVTITGCSQSAGDVAVPTTIDGYTVSSIGALAFEGCTGLTAIDMPSSLTSIGVSAFGNCTVLVTDNYSQPPTIIGLWKQLIRIITKGVKVL